MVIHQYEIYLICLDPTVGHEVQKTRPCLVISPDEMNDNLQTVIVAPMTTKSHLYPTRVALTFNAKQGFIVLYQIRTVDRIRLVKKLGLVSQETIQQVKSVLQEMLIE